MQAVKKGIKLMISIMGIVLFCACTKRVPVSVIPAGSPTPSQEISLIPTGTEPISPTKELVSPTKEPTISPTHTIIPSPTNIAVSTVPPSPTNTAVPTVTKTPTSTTVPTPTKKPMATKAPTVTKEITVTKTPTKVQEPTLTVTPIPTVGNNHIEEKPSIDVINETLLQNGWQSMIDISSTYYVVFSNCFNHSEIRKGETTLDIRYTSEQDKNIQFQVLYSIKQTANQVLDKVVEQGGIVLEKDSSNGSISYTVEKEQVVYQGIVLEKEYKRELLGDAFGEEDSIVGTMQVVFAYPKEQYVKYEADEFHYYLVRIP